MGDLVVTRPSCPGHRWLYAAALDGAARTSAPSTTRRCFAASPDPQACLVDRCQQCATGRCARGIQIPTKRCRNQISFDRRGCGEGLQLGLQPQQRTSFYALLNQRSRRLEALWPGW
jgi:hypothetical protein